MPLCLYCLLLLCYCLTLLVLVVCIGSLDERRRPGLSRGGLDILVFIIEQPVNTKVGHATRYGYYSRD